MSAKPDILLAEQVQLLTWGDSRKDGPWIKLRLPHHDLLQVFRNLDPPTGAAPRHVLDMVLAHPPESGAEAVSDDAGPPPADAPTSPGASPPSRQSPHPYGQFARLLFVKGVFLAPEVCRALGTDDGFLSWIRDQPCMMAGKDGVGPCEGRIQAAHVRRIANGAGVNLKPPFSAVPLCWRHHHEQHQHGESVLGDRDWWDRRRADYLTTWARRNLESMLGVESIGDVSPTTLLAWAQRNGVAHLLPREYREAA
jgi:hypothetical protein